MNFFANQKIQLRQNKVIKRTVVVRAQLSQMNYVNGLQANIKNEGNYPVLRWGECKRHNNNEMTRRMNVFQMYINGEPRWISENLIENSHALMKSIFASSTVGLYAMFYSPDFSLPLYQTSVSKVNASIPMHLSSVGNEVQGEKIRRMPTRKTPMKKIQTFKVSKSPVLPSLNSLNNFVEVSQPLPSLKNLSEMNASVPTALPKLNGYLM